MLDTPCLHRKASAAFRRLYRERLELNQSPLELDSLVDALPQLEVPPLVLGNIAPVDDNDIDYKAGADDDEFCNSNAGIEVVHMVVERTTKAEAASKACPTSPTVGSVADFAALNVQKMLDLVH